MPQDQEKIIAQELLFSEAHNISVGFSRWYLAILGLSDWKKNPTPPMTASTELSHVHVKINVNPLPLWYFIFSSLW